jgi:peptidoglycan/LPS O-acetylase OafA/YrhL
VRLAFADGIRGLAALWVVLFHASEGGHIDHLKAVLPAWLGRMLFDWGHLGVALFFVLSGFVMMHSVRGYAFSAGLGARFMLRRTLRLTPPYYASIVFVIAYVALKAVLQGQPVPVPAPGVVLAHALYLQDILALDTLSVVYWTLCIEIQFYLAFSLLMLARHHAGLRFGLARVTPVLLAIAAFVGLPWALGVLSVPLYKGGFLSFWYCFMLGVLVSVQAEDRWSRWICIVFVVALVVAGAITGSGFVWTSLAAAALIYAGSRVTLLEQLLNRRSLQFLGLISYSLYLTHNQVTGATTFALKRFLGGSALTELGLLAAIILACLLVATLGHRLVERPSIEWSRRVSLKGRGRAPMPAGT